MSADLDDFTVRPLSQPELSRLRLGGHLHPFAKERHYIAWWKRDKRMELKDLSHLGVFSDPMELFDRIDREAQRNPLFCREYAGGHFYPVLITPELVYKVDAGRLVQ